MNSTAKALRIQTIKLKQTFAVPWYSIGLATVLVMTIFAFAGDTPYSHRTTGALSAFYLSGAGMMPWLVNQLFPFSMAMSVTRIAFVRATMLIVAAESLTAGLGLAVLNKVEIATHGWFVHTRMLDLPYIHQDNFGTQALVYGVPMAAMSAVMAFVGTVFRAFGQLGLWLFAVATAVLGTIIVVVLTLTHSFGAAGHFFGHQPMLANFAVYPLILIAVFGGGWAAMMLRARV